MSQQNYSNLQLFLSFFRIGLFTFGGGMAMLPWLEQEMQKYNLEKDDILRIFSLAQSMPGMIATNVTTIVGRQLNGFWGSFWATLGVIFPSFLIILTLFFGLAPLLYKTWMQGALNAIRATAAMMILFSAVGLAKKVFSPKKASRLIGSALIVLAVILLSFLTTINPFIFILLAILFAIIEFFLQSRSKR